MHKQMKSLLRSGIFSIIWLAVLVGMALLTLWALWQIAPEYETFFDLLAYFRQQIQALI